MVTTYKIPDQTLGGGNIMEHKGHMEGDIFWPDSPTINPGDRERSVDVNLAPHKFTNGRAIYEAIQAALLQSTSTTDQSSPYLFLARKVE